MEEMAFFRSEVNADPILIAISYFDSCICNFIIAVISDGSAFLTISAKSLPCCSIPLLNAL